MVLSCICGTWVHMCLYLFLLMLGESVLNRRRVPCVYYGWTNDKFDKS